MYLFLDENMYPVAILGKGKLNNLKKVGAELEYLDDNVVVIKHHTVSPKVKLTRRNLLTRDGYTCQYCGKAGYTVDHVKPKSKGGKWRWDNLVAACKECNLKKGSKDWIPNSTPYKMDRKQLVKIRSKWYKQHDKWAKYLGGSNDQEEITQSDNQVDQ